jgi:hypothetical protein
MPDIPLDAFMGCIDPPSLFAPTHVWKRYLRDLRQMPRCATVRYEIKRARQELAWRRQREMAKRAELASRQLDLFPDTAPKISLPPLRPWRNPHAQLLWGQALIFSGKKHRDLSLIRKGWVHVSEARAQTRGQ